MSAAAHIRFQHKAGNMEPFWGLVGHNVNEGVLCNSVEKVDVFLKKKAISEDEIQSCTQ